jgi:transposase
MLKDDFPQIWVPNWENRDLRQLLWHRHRMVQTRTRIMNQLQSVALNEGLRCKKRLWRDARREQLEAFKLAPWASRRRRDLLDRLTPTIAELTAAIEQEVERCPVAQRLQTHPGVGATNGDGLRADHRESGSFSVCVGGNSMMVRAARRHFLLNKHEKHRSGRPSRAARREVRSG